MKQSLWQRFGDGLPTIERTRGGIANYSAETFLVDNDPCFILDYQNGNFYFDQDGDRDVGDQVLVANVARNPDNGGDYLADFHANQILVIPNFNLWA